MLRTKLLRFSRTDAAKAAFTGFSRCGRKIVVLSPFSPLSALSPLAIARGCPGGPFQRPGRRLRRLGDLGRLARRSFGNSNFTSSGGSSGSAS